METLFTFSPLVVAIVPIVLGLVQVAKSVGLPSQYAPILSIIFGIGMVLLAGAVWQVAIAQGIIIGLASSGLFSGSKKIIQG